MSNLQAAVVVDYQNVHLVGADLFPSSRGLDRHESLIDPLLFALNLIQARNERQIARGNPDLVAELRRVVVYRGLPLAENEPDANRRNQEQRLHWQRDPRVAVTLRPLKYTYQRDATGRPMTDGNGRKIVVGRPREKGIDVLCALAVVREAQSEDVDLVILGSVDSDLIPALDEALMRGQARVETCSWYHAAHPHGMRGQEIRPETRRVWNTRLNEPIFVRSRDLTYYS